MKDEPLVEAIKELTGVLIEIKDWLLTNKRPVSNTETKDAKTQAAEIAKQYRCPNCNRDMVGRVARATNEWFLGCSRYPVCKGTRNLNGQVTPKKKTSFVTEPPDDDCPF